MTVLLGEMGAAKRPDLVKQLLAWMGSEQMEINVFHCSSAASAYEKASHWQRAVLLLSRMSSWNVKPNEYTQSVLQRACAEGNHWQLALESRSPADRLSAVSCGVRSWDAMLLALSELIFCGLISSTALLLCSAVLSSLGTARHEMSSPWNPWATSLVLLQQLQDMRNCPDIVAVGAASSVCEKGAQWRWAKELLRTTWTWSIRPNLICFNSP